MTKEKQTKTTTKSVKTTRTAKRHLELLQEHEQIKLPDEVTNTKKEVLNQENERTIEEEQTIVNNHQYKLCDNNVLISEINSAIEVLKSVNIPTEEEVKAYWVAVMFDRNTDTKDRLTASRLLAQSQGMLNNNKAIASSGGAVYRWQTPTDAEVVHETKTTPEN